MSAAELRAKKPAAISETSHQCWPRPENAGGRGIVEKPLPWSRYTAAAAGSRALVTFDACPPPFQRWPRDRHQLVRLNR